MVEVISKGAYLYKGESIIGFENEISRKDLTHLLKEKGENTANLDKFVNPEEACKNTMTYDIIMKHNTSGNPEKLKLKFDALASHDLTFVGIIQTAKASGLKSFPLPYVLTNCHNSLCAVGGTINEDDHVFGLSAVKKYGGIYVPANVAVIHQYMREQMAYCGSMILGSDSHTRYGALGCMAIGEGGGELAKQLLNKTYDVSRPEVIAIYLEGKPRKGVGPQDIALAIIGTVFKSGFVKNKVMEFVGPGISNLSVDFRNGIDVMTTETTCLSSIWITDEKVKEYLEIHKRPEAYKKMNPGTVAYYDGLVRVDMGKVEPMIALPFHPSNVYTVAELNKNPEEIFKTVEDEAVKLLDNPKIKFKLTDKIVDGRIKVDQGIIAGCSGGTFENIYMASKILKNASVGNDYFNMNVYPASQPVYLELIKNGALADLTEAGVIIKPAFCGPCFGAGDTPSNNAFSIRHTTRNFPNREGSKPGVGQISSVALMDALSIAATALNGGYLTPATEIDFDDALPAYNFDDKVYRNRVNQSFNQGNENAELKYGPSIADWPEMFALEENVLLKMASVIHDPVTTTDELIPSGETSSYRSDPNKLSEFTLSRRDPEYVGRAKAARELEKNRQAFIRGNDNTDLEEVKAILVQVLGREKASEEELKNIVKNTSFGSTIFAVKPGDGSAREQAASCQKVLGGLANISVEYATKRYRSNLINWGMIPFIIPQTEDLNFEVGEYIFIEGIKSKIKDGIEEMEAQVISDKGNRKIKLQLKSLTKDEKDIILAGSLINYNASDNKQIPVIEEHSYKTSANMAP